MKSRFIGILILTVIMFVSLVTFSSVVFADTGSGSDDTDWRVVIYPIVIFLWAIYWPALQKEWSSIWQDKSESTGRKIGYSISAIVGCLLPCLKTTWKQYGGSIIALIVALVKARLGIPAGIQKVKARTCRQ